LNEWKTENGGKNSIQTYYLEINEIYLAAEPQHKQQAVSDQKPQDGSEGWSLYS